MKIKRKIGKINDSNIEGDQGAEVAGELAESQTSQTADTSKESHHILGGEDMVPVDASEHQIMFSGETSKRRKKTDDGEGPKKKWTKRPDNWREIAEFYKNNTLEATQLAYQDILGEYSTNAQYHKLHAWKRELEAGIDVKTVPPGREPAYGNDIDERLLTAVLRLLQDGIMVDDALMRSVLVDLLTEVGKDGLLIENGGSCVFQQSWAQRFWKRHEKELKDLRVRCLTLNMMKSKHDGGGGKLPVSGFAHDAETQALLMSAGAAEAGGLEDEGEDAEGGVRTGTKGSKHSLKKLVVRKPWTRRPDNWQQMAEFFAGNGITAALAEFPNELQGLTYSGAYQKLNNWRNDMATQRELHSPGRPPNYGDAIDLQLLSQVQERMDRGMSVDDNVLRELLVGLLVAHGRDNLLRENGGDCTFGHSWATRFRKRHNLPTRDLASGGDVSMEMTLQQAAQQANNGRKRVVAITQAGPAAAQAVKRYIHGADVNHVLPVGTTEEQLALAAAVHGYHHGAHPAGASYASYVAHDGSGTQVAGESDSDEEHQSHF